MKRILFLALSLSAPLFGWSQGLVDKIVAEPENKKNCTSWEAYPNGLKAAQEKHVIYTDLMRIKKYDEAFPIWQELISHVTTPEGRPTRHFMDGVTLYSMKMQTEQDASKMAEYAKEIHKLYEANTACNGEDLTNRAYQAYYLYYYSQDAALALKILERTYQFGKDKMPTMVFEPYAYASVEAFKANVPAYNGDKMREIYAFFKNLIEAKRNSKAADLATYEAEWTKVQEKFAEIETKIFDCDYFVSKWQKAFETAPENQAQNAEILEELKRKAKCEESNAFYQKVEAAYAPHRAYLDSVRQDSLFKCCMSNAQRAGYLERKGDREQAFEYYKKSLGDADLSSDEKAQIAYRIAYYHFQSRDFGTARSYCRRASEFRPNWAEPYTLVGLMYASSGKLCGPGTGWDSQVVVWAAMDEWSKACSVDPENCSEARKHIGQYSAYLPTKEDGFQRNIAAGSAYKIGCWIGVTTTVRFK